MTSSPIVALEILATSFFSTHHASAADVLAGRERSSTPPTFPLLVARARRFTSLATQLHIEVCGALPIDPAAPPQSVFATCHGEIRTAETLIADFRANAMVSSARFALSVHNTPSGLYSVATGSNAASTTMTGNNAIAAGWLEAALTALEARRAVLLSIADEPVPAIFEGPTERVGVAAAFLLAPASPGSVRRAQLSITTPTATAAGTGPTEGVDTVRILARTVDAWSTQRSITLNLGPIRPGACLELAL